MVDVTLVAVDGAGGYRTNGSSDYTIITGTTYTVTVGTGGGKQHRC